ncbi:MAG: nucleotidyltransferase [Devosia sp.]|nr:nucleotidyltransferase [Devosia sp.]
MKLTKLFNEFLADTVNLNTTRLTQLEDGVDALKRFVRDSDWAPTIIGFEPQGSWAHKTIIRPVDGGEFDADLIINVKPVDGWTAADYVADLGRVFKASSTYSDKTKVWDYCVTINYANERKVDLAPCVIGREVADRTEVCNRPEDCFELSEPAAYTEWLREANSYSGSNSFRKVTRLLKYLRDIKRTFTCPSVLLTTLVGYRIEWFDKDSDDFLDVPCALQTIMARLDDWLQACPDRPQVPNPKLQSEDFGMLWADQTQYANFRNFIHKYRGWVDEAIAAPTRSESIDKWRRIFGDQFAYGEEIKMQKASVLAELANSLMMSTAAHADDLVEWVRDFGTTILPGWFKSPSHLKQPTWHKAENVSSRVYVTAAWAKDRQASSHRLVQSGDVLRNRGGLWFDVLVNDNEPLPAGFRVQWRITNTGRVAMSRGAGRGGFETPHTGNRRWESLSYRGVHMAEALVIRNSDDVLVGQSESFYVVIE